MPSQRGPLAREPPNNTLQPTQLGIIRDSELCRLFRARNKRHSMAVHRLVAWYREGADVQRLLPQLATYLGHVDVAATQRYLTMTPELLREASQRFARYALPEMHHE
jgi:integrase/recombinase XerD